MTMQRSAWQVCLQDHSLLVIAQSQVIEYLSRIDTVTVPDCHPRSRQIVEWRNHIVPVLGAESQQSPIEQLLIIGFNDATPDRPAFLALALRSPPSAITVHDHDQCAPPATLQAHWGKALCCCIKHQDDILPIVDFARIK